MIQALEISLPSKFSSGSTPNSDNTVGAISYTLASSVEFSLIPGDMINKTPCSLSCHILDKEMASFIPEPHNYLEKGTGKE